MLIHQPESFYLIGSDLPLLGMPSLLLNKSSWDMSRRKIFIGKFHLHSTPHLFRLSSQAPKEKDWENKEVSSTAKFTNMVISTDDLGQCLQREDTAGHTSWHRVCRNLPPSPTSLLPSLGSFLKSRHLLPGRVSGELVRLRSPSNLEREKQAVCLFWDDFINV